MSPYQRGGEIQEELFLKEKSLLNLPLSCSAVRFCKSFLRRSPCKASPRSGMHSGWVRECLGMRRVHQGTGPWAGCATGVSLAHCCKAGCTHGAPQAQCRFARLTKTCCEQVCTLGPESTALLLRVLLGSQGGCHDLLYPSHGALRLQGAEYTTAHDGAGHMIPPQLCLG